MGLKKLAGKLEDYRQRLEAGKASKIKPDHVEKVLGKLDRKIAELEAALEAEERADRRERLDGKLRIAREQRDRAEWLRGELG